jgi:hypothetical protein
MAVIAEKDMADLRAGKLVMLDKDGNILQIEDYLALARAEYEKHDKAVRHLT